MPRYKVTDDRIARVVGVIRARGWQTQEDVLKDFDAHPDWAAVRDIGRVLAPTMRFLMALPPDEFSRLMDEHGQE